MCAVPVTVLLCRVLTSLARAGPEAQSALVEAGALAAACALIEAPVVGSEVGGSRVLGFRVLRTPQPATQAPSRGRADHYILYSG